MQQNLISLWHFDENSRHIAINALPGRNPLFIHGAVHRSRRFGQALELRLPGDRATGDGPGRLLCGSVCFWVQVNGGRGQVELLNIQGMIQITIDLSQGLALIASVDDRVLSSESRLSNGQWHHITLTFNADGLKLYLDAKKVAESDAHFAGLSVSSSRQNYLQIGPLPPAAGPVLIDELALFNQDLMPAHIEDLLQGVLEPTLPNQNIPEPKFVDATAFVDRNDPSCGLQKAIDSLGLAGGIVQLPMGRFILRQSLKLTSRTLL
ncbi:MAG: LamG domain-containing protein, partial [Phycisphaeraceae bacterium]|nr:LamG domain-containing protein [Phycisphaeraceae bacterium]